jgi:hypothetical protein
VGGSVRIVVFLVVVVVVVVAVVVVVVVVLLVSFSVWYLVAGYCVALCCVR